MWNSDHILHHYMSNLFPCAHTHVTAKVPCAAKWLVTFTTVKPSLIMLNLYVLGKILSVHSFEITLFTRMSHILMPSLSVDLQVIFLEESAAAFFTFKRNALVDALFMIIQPTCAIKISSTCITLKPFSRIFHFISHYFPLKIVPLLPFVLFINLEREQIGWHI